MNMEPILPEYEEGDPWADFAETLFEIMEEDRPTRDEQDEYRPHDMYFRDTS